MESSGKKFSVSEVVQVHRKRRQGVYAAMEAGTVLNRLARASLIGECGEGSKLRDTAGRESSAERTL